MFNENTWHSGEKLAAKHLKKLGYKIVGTNICIAGVEADIVAILPRRLAQKQLKKQYKNGELCKTGYLAAKKQSTNTLVVAEVKARVSYKYGYPEEAVNTQKQQHLRRFAEAYTKANNIHYPVQFDIVAVRLPQAEANAEIRHIPNAF